VLVLGRSHAQDAGTALYHDERGVCRVSASDDQGSTWRKDFDLVLERA
jgi:hypothetical protein